MDGAQVLALLLLKTWSQETERLSVSVSCDYVANYPLVVSYTRQFHIGTNANH